MNLPNSLTLVRMVLVPLLVVVLLTEFEGRQIFGLPKELVGAAIFAIASITDWLDGYLARRLNQMSAFGAFLDPVADKLLVTALLIVLALPNPELTVRIPPWIAILSIGRDAGILLAVLVFHLAGANRSFPPSFLGKATTVAHLVTILWILACNYLGQDHPLTQVFLGVTVVLVLVSAMHYLYLGQQVVAQETEKERG